MLKNKILTLTAISLFVTIALVHSFGMIGRTTMTLVALILLAIAAGREQPAVVSTLGMLAAVAIVASNLSRGALALLYGWVAVGASTPVTFSNYLFSKASKRRTAPLQIVRGGRANSA